MRMYDVIKHKRDGMSLSNGEIEYFINEYTNGRIPDYQASALLMAIYLRGMIDEECANLTNAIVYSGDTIDLSKINGIKVDKHSTGGVGDSVTLALAPLVASVGVPVAKMSGRGLGHTGGTIDKLESIDGFHVEIDNNEFIHLVNQNKLAIIGQSKQLTPGDQLLYSLRDVTATVDSIPLIASSVMSKKIAAGADAIMLDVKTGSGAFMTDLDAAKKLAETMVSIGKLVGRNTRAIISNMDEPLGFAIGNALEIKEVIDILNNEGPEDLRELCLTLGSHMVVLAEKAMNIEEARLLLEENLINGKALSTFKTFIRAQGGNEEVVDNPSLLPTATFQIPLVANKSGVIKQLNAEQIGHAAMMLGAGRETKESIIDLAVGLILHKKVGDQVDEGDVLLTIHSNNKAIEEVSKKLYESILLTNDDVEKKPLIYDVIQ